MAIIPLRSEHADKIVKFPSAIDPRLTVKRHLINYAYPENGNVHNPTPEYQWLLLADGQLVDQGRYYREMLDAAASYGPQYLAEMDDRCTKGSRL